MEALFAARKIPVSRETSEKLSIYDALLLKWQKAINLVSPTTLEDRIERHFIDSAQLFQYIPAPERVRLADLGSGAGFPGMVLAIMGAGEVHLIESDIRKATFLREVSRETMTPVTVHDCRIEKCLIENVDLITARALAPLNDLFGYAEKLATPGHEFSCLFLKGGQINEEKTQAEKQWKFKDETFGSVTDDSGKIIKINNLIKK